MIENLNKGESEHWFGPNPWFGAGARSSYASPSSPMISHAIPRRGGFTGYFAEGFSFMLGNIPHAKLDNGAVLHNFMGAPVNAMGNPVFGVQNKLISSGSKLAIPEMDKFSKFGWAGFTLGATGLNLALGYSDGGLRGAFEYGMFDVAVNAAVSRSVMKGPVARAAAGSVLNIGAGSLIPRFGAATIGASLGQSVAGVPGMFAGAAMSLHPAGWVVGAATLAGYGIYQGGKAVLKAGYRHRQNQKMIDTAGDMSAFMTRNAMTMRARAVDAIHKSHLNARSALGMEANYLAMAHRRYHSPYRV